MIEFLDWVARAGGVIAFLTALLGFMFHEKWKQLLQRSLSEDLVKLKNELAKSQMDYAASLTPQLESIKHDFQQKLEAYKVSLIAEAEAVKAKGELKKNLALRYAEIEFQRLVNLEGVVSSIATEFLSMASIDTKFKREENSLEAITRIRELGNAMNEAAMCLSIEERLQLSKLRRELVNVMVEHIGPDTPTLDGSTELQQLSSAVEEFVRGRIRSLAKL